MTSADRLDAGTASRVAGRRVGVVALIAVSLSVMALMWIVAMPPTAGPDEPSHLVRAGGLIRGQETVRGDFGSADWAYDLPIRIGFPDPGCYAFQPSVPATCADLDAPEGSALLGTRSSSYPIWGHVLAGIGTLVPGEASGYVSRSLDAAVPLALLTGAFALVRRRGPLAVGALVLAVTPMAWFSFAVVNPSGLVIAGGVALWLGLLGLAERVPPPDVRFHRILATSGWVAAVLPRRDGLVWASLIAALVVVFADVEPLELARRLGRVALAVVGVSTIVMMVWAFRSPIGGTSSLVVAPLAPCAAVGLRRAWRSVPSGRMQVLAVVVGAAVSVAGVLVVMDRRRDGFDREVLRTIVGRTGADLREAIGNLGWLDTPVPISAIFLWLAALGALAGAVLAVGAVRPVGLAAATIVLAVVASWTLTMLQNDDAGQYWQGRYYLPLLVGVALAIGRTPIEPRMGRRVGLVVAIAGLVVVNVAFAAAMRRFGVGIDGSLVPTDWNTYGSPLAPALALAIHAVASVGLIVVLDRTRSAGPVRQ